MNNTNTMAKKKKKKGFTLIELIIVMAIMAILAAIAIPSFNAVRENSRKKADTHSCEVINKAIMTLVADGTVTVTDPAGETIKFNHGANVSAADSAFTYTNILAGSDAANAIEGALADVKDPQDINTVTQFQIVITNTGAVTVTTI